jgi:uncharacterized membrane protein
MPDAMRLLGHPIHPMLVHFPVAFWTVAAAAYVAAAVGIGDAAAAIAKFSNGAGLIMAMLRWSQVCWSCA